MRSRLTKLISSPLGGTIILLGIVLFGTAFYLHESGGFSPGPLSASQSKGQPLGGFPSHAAFEQQCSHCHAPIHCITDNRCQECHLEVARERAAAEGLHGRLPAGRCQSCHVEHRGREAIITEFAFANVDHDKLAGFSLAHHRQNFDGSSLTCESCHSQQSYAHETLDCISCHSGAEHDRMAEHIHLFGSDCLACHDGRDRMANFDHNQNYPLEGKHADLQCQECHQDHVFMGTARDCVACHQEPDLHAGQFGLDCARCHTPAAWAPAQLTQHTFHLDHGGQGLLACETCHTQNYAANSCYGCHDHTPQQMAEIHLLAGLTDFENCAGCHPTGQPNEAERLLNGPNPPN